MTSSEVLDAFRSIDPSGSGTITQAQFGELSNTLDMPLSEQSLKKIFQALGVVDDAPIKYERLIAWLFGPEASNRHQRSETQTMSLALDFAADEQQRMLEFLLTVNLFKQFAKEDHASLVAACLIRDCPTGHVFFEQGDEGSDFFIIVSGKASVSIDGSVVKHVGIGDYFGERSLLTSERRSATIAAEGETRVLKIARTKFFELGLQTKLQISKCRRRDNENDHSVLTKPASVKTPDELELIVDALSSTKSIMTLGNTKKWQALAEVMWEESVQAGTVVFAQGSDVMDYFYIVKSGVLTCDIDGKQIRSLDTGDSFGELALLYEAPRTATIMAETDSVLWLVDYKHFNSVLSRVELRKAERSATLAKKNNDLIPWLQGFDFSFVDANKLLESSGALPKHQELRELDGWLITQRISIREILSGEKFFFDVASVSYVWQTKEHPDPHGEQTDAVRAFLREHRHIRKVFIDWLSLPQKERSPEDTDGFRLGLKNINMIYLATTVLVVLSPHSLERFWPQFEGFLSFQGIGPEGLIPDANQRSHLICPASVDASEKESLKAEFLSKWSTSTIESALQHLAAPGTVVTNGTDKELQLGKLIELRDELILVMAQVSHD